MKFNYLNKQYSISLDKFAKPKNKCSKLHKTVRLLLKELFPFDILLEEFPLPGIKPKLYADFFLPSQNLAVEAHGEQHFKDNRFFFKNKQKFLLACNNDRKKIDWFYQNNIDLIALHYNESIDEWRTKIIQRNVE